MKVRLAILILFFCTNLLAQEKNFLRYDKNSTYKRMYDTVLTDKLIGRWQNAAMPRYIIEIKRDSTSMVYLFGVDQFSSYHFSRKDSIHVSAVGVIMRWPPSYCYVVQLDDKTLELEFSGVARSNPITYKFKRMK